jgi:hypothetical protein
MGVVWLPRPAAAAGETWESSWRAISLLAGEALDHGTKNLSKNVKDVQRRFVNHVPELDNLFVARVGKHQAHSTQL